MTPGDQFTYLLLRGLSWRRVAPFAALGVLVLAAFFPDVWQHGVTASVEFIAEQRLHRLQPMIDAYLDTFRPAP